MFTVIKLLCLGMVSSSLAWLALSLSGWFRDRTRRGEIAELKLEVERLTREMAIQSRQLEFMGATVSKAQQDHDSLKADADRIEARLERVRKTAAKARFEQGVQRAILNTHETTANRMCEFIAGVGFDVADQGGRLRILESRYGVVSFDGVGEIEPVFTREV